MIHGAASNVSLPGEPVPANLGPEPLSIARDMMRRGLDPITFRVADVADRTGMRPIRAERW